LNDSSYDGGWRLDPHLCSLADVTEDGLLDIVGFGENHVYIGRNNGNGTFSPAQFVIDNCCIGASGWQISLHSRFVADLTGGGRVDIIGCGDVGCDASSNNGRSGFGPVNIVINDFGTVQGWQMPSTLRVINIELAALIP
jgi:hypothetical protein